MGGKNNTTPIGDGSVGIDTSEGVGREIQKAVSENNLKYQIGQNTSIKGVFNATVQMVSRWQRGDKYRILQEYSSAESVGQNPSDAELNQAVATTLISNLPKNELKRIIGSELSSQTKLVKDVKNLNSKSLSLNKKYFNMGTAQEYMQNVAPEVSNPKQMLKLMKNEDKSFKVNKHIANRYKSLQKEITTYLRGLTKQEVARLAVQMELPLADNSSFKDTANMISSTVIMYVNLIIGKTSGISPSRFSDSEISAIEEILQSTSFGWVTGKVGLNDIEVSNNRKKAMAAKKQLLTNKKIAAQQSRYIKETFFKKKKDVKRGILEKGFFKKNIERNQKFLDSLSGLTETDIRNLAATKGINDAEFGNISDIKNQLAKIMAGESKAVIDLERKALKIKNPAKREQALNDVKAAKSGSTINAAARLTTLSTQDYSDQIPVVTFNQDGKLASEGILKAVPVFIAGTAEKVGKIQTRKESKMISEADLRHSNRITDEYFRYTEDDLNLHGTRKTLDALSKKEGKGKDLSQLLDLISSKSMLGQALEGDAKTHYDKMGVKLGSSILAGGNIRSIPFSIDKDVIEKFDHIDESKSMAASDQKQFNLIESSRLRTEKAKKSLSVAQLKGKVSSLGERGFSKLRIANKSGTSVIPVIDINKTHDYAAEIRDYAEQSKNYLGALNNKMSILFQIWGTLQNVGTTANMASAGSVTAMALDTLGQIQKAGTAAITQMATGGSMRGKNFSSNIITGDHPHNKNNTELVSVDWANKNINVKPIPKMASGGKVSNVDNINRMNVGERNKPLSVGIGAGVVHYNKKFNDVSDDRTDTAVKVYSINSGINEKIKIGDSEISLFDTVYGIYSSILSLNQSIAMSNQLLSSISSNTHMTNTKLNNLKSENGGQPFNFSQELNSILSGE